MLLHGFQVVFKLNLLQDAVEVDPEFSDLFLALGTVALVLPLLKSPVVMLILRLFLEQVLQVRRIALGREVEAELVLDSLQEQQLQHPPLR